jgi:hypothetical protein
VQSLTPPDHRARLLFCQWRLIKCVVNTQFVANICLLMKRNSQGTVLRTFTMPMSGWTIIPTPSWHQDINIDFPPMSGWEF